MKAFLCFFILLLTFQNSGAVALRCSDLFALQSKVSLDFANAKDSAEHYAQALDVLNEKYNRFLFTNNLQESLKPDLDGLSFFEATQARYRAHRLRKTLIKLHEFDQYLNPKADREEDLYALEKVAIKLERLTFLNDRSVTQGMSLVERVDFNQARHSLLSQGMARFLFDGEPPPPPGVLRKILTPFRIALKEVYFRWVFALGYMPKLHGSAIPFEIIEKVVLEGYDQNKDLLKPYLLTARGKAFFNVFSSSYNYILAGVLAISAADLAHYAYQDVYLKGIEKAEAMVKPLNDNANQLAQTDFKASRKQKALASAVEGFKIKFHRDPTDEELQTLKALIETKVSSMSQS